MDYKKYIACGALLTAAFCALGLSGAVGESQARYLNQASWHTVVHPTVRSVTADSLAGTGQPPLINLMGTLTAEGLELPITLTTEKNLSGPVTWSVNGSAYASVELSLGATQLHQGDVIGLTAAKPTVLNLTVKPTALGLTQRQGGTVDIEITWKNTLTGVFQVELPGSEEPQEPQSQVEISTVKAFHWEAAFPVELTATSATQAMLSLGEDPFPAGTRFSPDGGNRWYRLCQPQQIPVEVSGSQSTILLLDLSRTEPKNGLTLGAGDNRIRIAAVSTPIERLSNQVLTTQKPIQVLLTNAWTDCQFDYRVELLTAAEGTSAYVPVDLSTGQLNVSYSPSETSPMLTLSGGQTLPQPGTYRLRLSWSREGICFHRSETIFFVNDTQQTGGAQ